VILQENAGTARHYNHKKGLIRGMNIYVGNLPFSTSQEELRSVFAAFGEVSAARIVSDRETGRPKGFGFVDMPNDDEARNAIEALNGNDIGGRKAVVNEARPREARPRRKEW
jgi:RNA recognition motif-containing protein